MKLTLVRSYNTDNYCIGHLYINGKFFCDTIEDKDRGLDDKMPLELIKGRKIYGKTAIPTGTYGVTLNVISPRLSKKAQYSFCKGYVPRLLNVKGFDGVLMHIGNTAQDSYGCILVGENKVKGQVINSTQTFRKLYDILSKANEKHEGIYIEITRKYKV